MSIPTKTINCPNQCYMKTQCIKYEKCPIILAQEILAGKCKILILWYLSSNSLRLCELRKLLPQVDERNLTQQLRSLEEVKLIYRKVYPIVPPKVEYGLTEAGKKMLPILDLMYSFGVSYKNTGYHK